MQIDFCNFHDWCSWHNEPQNKTMNRHELSIWSRRTFFLDFVSRIFSLEKDFCACLSSPDPTTQLLYRRRTCVTEISMSLQGCWLSKCKYSLISYFDALLYLFFMSLIPWSKTRDEIRSRTKSSASVSSFDSIHCKRRKTFQRTLNRKHYLLRDFIHSQRYVSWWDSKEWCYGWCFFYSSDSSTCFNINHSVIITVLLYKRQKYRFGHYSCEWIICSWLFHQSSYFIAKRTRLTQIITLVVPPVTLFRKPQYGWPSKSEFLFSLSRVR